MLEAIVQLLNQGSDWARAMWQNNMNQQAVKDQNAYNSPKAQVLRLRQAGLNPALAYTQLQGATQTAPVEYTAPSIDFSGMAQKAVDLSHARASARSAKVHANVDEATQSDLASMRHSESSDRRIMRDVHDLLYQKEGARFRNTDAFSELANYESAVRTKQLHQLEMNYSVSELHKRNLELDNQIKGLEKSQREYYQNLRRNYGIERTDTPWLRLGVGAGEKVRDYFQGHFNRNLKH